MNSFDTSTVGRDPPLPQRNCVPAATSTAVQQPQFGLESQIVHCPCCKVLMMTDVDYVASPKTHAFACACILCSPLLCCLIPYCMRSLKNVNHQCSKCRAFLGTYKA